MSHLHLPDGVLPWWVWVAGWLVTIIWVAIICRVAARRTEVLRTLPLLAVVSAFMLVSMSIEIVPLAYHVNLSVLAGALLGPLLAPVAALIVECALALMGHGGITVIGANTVILSLEMIIGALVFRGAVRALGIKHVRLTAGISTIIALGCSTAAMLAVTSTIGGVFPTHEGDTVNMHTFLTTIVVLAPFGWALEAVITGGLISYIAKVRPALLTGDFGRRGVLAIQKRGGGSPS